MQEGIDSLSGYGRVFYTNVLLSGAVPQISLICGPCAGGAAYSPALTDFIIQTRQAQMFITGPQVIKQVTGEQITRRSARRPDAHMTHSGVIHFIAENDEEAAYLLPPLLSFLPANNLEDPPRLPSDNNVEPEPALTAAVPVDPKQGYDVRDVIHGVVDQADFLEVQAGYAMNMVVGFGRFSGGRLESSPISLRSCRRDRHQCRQQSGRFIRFCNAFNIPLVTFVDVPGFLPGVQQEHGGIIRHGAKCCLPTRRPPCRRSRLFCASRYGGAHWRCARADLGADRVFAWPTAEVAVMGAEGAVEIVFRKEMQEAVDKPAKRPRID